MNNFPTRMVIHTKDIMVISGISERSASRLLNRIRKHKNIPPGSFITIEDFCSFTGLKEEKVRLFIK